MREFADTVNGSIFRIVATSLLFTSFMMAAALPLIDLVYRRGQFLFSDSQQTAIYFFWFSLSLAFWSAQGLYAACSAGLFMMLATAAAGPLFGAFAGRAYLAMAAMSLMAGGLAFIVMRISPTRPGVADASGFPHR